MEKHQNTSYNINIVATFYTGSIKENGGYANITSSGKRLSRGMCASPSNLKFGTKIKTENLGLLTVEDRGNVNYIHWINENTIRLDIYVPSKSDIPESGIVKTKGYIIK
jgi:3D (Asp-Asp-Asp) domain-containing protein